MKRSLCSSTAPLCKNLFSFFPRTPSKDLPSCTGDAEPGPSPATSKKINAPLPSLQPDIKLTKTRPLCTSDPSEEFVLLGPSGVQELKSLAGQPTLSEGFYNDQERSWMTLCGSQKRVSSPRRRRRRLTTPLSLSTHKSTPSSSERVRPQRRRKTAKGPFLSPDSVTRPCFQTSSFSPLSSQATPRLSPPFPSLSSDTSNPLTLRESIVNSAKTFFGIENLTPFQISAVQACFEGKDVFVVLPTGAGVCLNFLVSLQ